MLLTKKVKNKLGFITINLTLSKLDQQQERLSGLILSMKVRIFEHHCHQVTYISSHFPSSRQIGTRGPSESKCRKVMMRTSNAKYLHLPDWLEAQRDVSV